MILIPRDLKADLLHALYQNVGLETPGQGIAFTLPVDDVVGIVNNDTIKKMKFIKENIDE